jgi:hypothetical protein
MLNVGPSSPLRIAGIPPAARTEPGAAGTVAVRIAGVPSAMQIFGETRESQDSRTADLEILQKDTEYNEETTVTKVSPLRSPWLPSVKKEPAEKRVSKIMDGKIIGGEISDSHDGFSDPAGTSRPFGLEFSGRATSPTEPMLFGWKNGSVRTPRPTCELYKIRPRRVSERRGGKVWHRFCANPGAAEERSLGANAFV